MSENPKVSLNLDMVKFQKMALIFNALEEGWSVKKANDKYIFSKHHKGNKEVYLDSYLAKFLDENLDINKLLE